MKTTDKLELCRGCRDNFYNGNNDLGVKRCWNFKDARVVQRHAIPIWQPPPYGMPAERTLSCHRRKGYAMFSAESFRAANDACARAEAAEAAQPAAPEAKP